MECRVIEIEDERECSLITLKAEGKERSLRHKDVSSLLNKRNKSDIHELVYLNKHCKMIFGTPYHVSDMIFLNIVFEDVVDWEYKITARYDKETNQVLFSRIHRKNIRDIKDATYDYIMDKEIYPNMKKLYTEINERLLKK